VIILIFGEAYLSPIVLLLVSQHTWTPTLPGPAPPILAMLPNKLRGPYHYYTSSFQVMKYKQADLIRRIECFAMCKLISCDKLFKNEMYYGGVMLVSGT
jgi:hypothetical protein